MKKNLLMTLIMMFVALTSGMKAMAAEKQAYYVFNGGTLYFYYDKNYDSQETKSKGLYGYYPLEETSPYWTSYIKIKPSGLCSTVPLPTTIRKMYNTCLMDV